MFVQAMEFLLGTLLGLLTLAFLLRCYLQLTGAPFHNPLSQAVVSLTNFAVRPVRRIVPSMGWLDTASLLLALLTQLVLQLAILWLSDFPLMVADPQVYAALLGLAVLGVVKLSLYIILYAVILQAVMSWINPHTPLAPVLDSLTRPLLRPLRRYMPSTAGIDLTPLIVFIFIELLLMLLIAPIEQQLLQLF
jgi:YggT family protein